MKNYDTKMILWVSTLTFVGAYINSIALLRYSIPVGNVTGSWNRGVQDISFLDIREGMLLFYVVFSFLIGTIISGIIFSDDKFVFKKKYENYLNWLGATLFLTTFFYGTNEHFIFVIALIIGMQNGIFITYRNTTCRTTHLTGITTEIGTQIGKIFRGKGDTDRLKFGFINISMAILGIGFGAKIYEIFNTKGFYIAALGYFFSAYMCKTIRKEYFLEDKEGELKKKYMKL